MSESSYRFYEIDLLRFLAALSVVFFHYTFRGHAADDLSVLCFPYLGKVSRYGYLGFQLFFIISGYVMLLSSYRKNRLEFIISRIVRLYPAYWFAVTLTFFTILSIGGSRYSADWTQYIINLTMMHGYVGVASIDGVYWTLMVEIKFYFLIFLIIFMNQMNNVKYYLGVWLALTIVLTRYDVRYLEFFLFPEWSSYFIAGACFYLIYREGSSIYKVCMVCVSFLLSNYYALLGIQEFNNHFDVELNSWAVILFIALFYVTFFMISLRKTDFINSKKFVLMGVLTYPLYLIHQNIGYMLLNFLHTYGFNKYITLALVLLVMLIAAHLIHRQIERKYSKYISRGLFKLRSVMDKR